MLKYNKWKRGFLIHSTHALSANYPIPFFLRRNVLLGILTVLTQSPFDLHEHYETNYSQCDARTKCDLGNLGLVKVKSELSCLDD